jgi:hypothetical protein
MNLAHQVPLDTNLEVVAHAYTGHYMLFSGFHNSCGLRSDFGQWYRITNGFLKTALHLNCDHPSMRIATIVLLNTTEKNRTDVKIQVNVEYSAASGTP